MTRGVDTTMLAAIEAGTAQLAYLVTMYLDAGTTYYTTANSDLSWGGNTYLAGTVVMAIGAVTESDDLKLHDLTVVMGGADQSNIAIAMGDTTHRRLDVKLAAVQDGAVMSTPVTYFDGWIDGYQVNESEQRGESVITMRVSSHLSHYARTNGRRTTNAVQQVHFSGDDFFEFAGNVITDRVWGRPG